MADTSASGSSPKRPERAPSPFSQSDNTTTRASSDGLPPPLPRRKPSGSSVGSHATSASPPPRSSHAAYASHRSAHRHNRSSAGFLLSDALDGAVGYDAALGPGVARPASSGHTRSTRQSTGKGRSSSGRVHSGHSSAHGGSAHHTASPQGLARPVASSAAMPSTSTTPTDATAAAHSSTSDNAATLAVDSAQIVNMALKLSETRRQAASHRPLSAGPTLQNGGAQATTAQPLPPRLTPLPDSAVGGSLRHQLQQQRRVSRTASPRPEKGPDGSNRAVSAASFASTGASNGMPGLQPAFDPANGSPNRFFYKFSPATLARAQKAKDHLELLAQHRRLLSFLPPLVPPSAPTSSRSRATSFNGPPLASSSSNTEPSGTAAPVLPLGRPYNPLQYIRNRKVRARERKTIDGQAQGFGDVGKTTAWIDGVEKWASALTAAAASDTASSIQPPPLPPFPCADQCNAAAQQGCLPPPATTASRVAVAAGAGALGKPKRARIDWDIDPADMLADIYWLEQDDNKRLVEDRHWRRVFPQDPSLYWSLSRGTDDAADARPPLPPRRAGHSTALDPLAAPLSTLGVDPNDQVLRLPPLLAPLSPSPEDLYDQDYGGSARHHARESARQKLQEIRGFHHRHSGALHGHSRDHVLRLRRNSSSSSTSASDSDGRRIRPKATTDRWPTRADPSYGPANGADALLEIHRDRERGRSGSSVSTQAATRNNVAGGGAGSSLETPGTGRRLSGDYESSQPTSPELHPQASATLGLVPTHGDSLSTPPSRTGSPPRHHQRFSKVKSIFRDHSHETDRNAAAAAADHTADERDTEGVVGSAGGGDLLTGAASHQRQPSTDATATGPGASEGSYPITPVVTINGQGQGPVGRQGTSRSPVRKIASAGSRANAPGAFDGGHLKHESMGGTASLRHDSNASGGSARLPVAAAGGAGAAAGSSASGAGVRGLMRGSRFGFVSKVSDMFWRRGPAGGEPSTADPAGANGAPTGGIGQNGQTLGPTAAAAEAQASADSSDDDSDGTAAATTKVPATAATASRGRSHKPAPSSRPPSTHSHAQGDEVSPMARVPGSRATAAAEAAAGDKRHHYLDVMPSFGRGDSASSAGTGMGAGAAGAGEPLSRPPSRQSARFERLKPPRIDVQDVSPPVSSPGPGQRTAPRRGSQLDSDMSEADGRVSRSRRSSHVSHASRASRTSRTSRASMGTASKGGGTATPQSNHHRGSQNLGSTSTVSGPASVADDRRGRWSVSQPAPAPGGSLSRRELARMRASLYSSAVLAQELIRRVNEPRVLVSTGWTPGRRRLGPANATGSSSSIGDNGGNDNDDEKDDVAVQTGTETEPDDDVSPGGARDARDGRTPTGRSKKRTPRHGRSRSSGGSLKSVVVVRGSGGAPQWDGHKPAQVLTWADIAAYAPDPEAVAWRPVKAAELYPLAGQVLGAAVQRQGQAWQATAEVFTGQTAPQLRARIEQVHTQVAGALSEGARHAADAADEVNRDLVAVQRLQVKQVLDSIDKMSRRRRQRFRWVRRAGWLTVEWALVGIMWYVWFMVMLVRVVLGAAGGVVAGVRWLLWLQ